MGERRFTVDYIIDGKTKSTTIIISNKNATVDDAKDIVWSTRPRAEILKVKELECIDEEGGEWK